LDRIPEETLEQLQPLRRLGRRLALGPMRPDQRAGGDAIGHLGAQTARGGDGGVGEVALLDTKALPGRADDPGRRLSGPFGGVTGRLLR
jgi:hypothetical protein